MTELDPRGAEDALQGAPAAPLPRAAREGDGDGFGDFLLGLSGQGGTVYMAETDRWPVDRLALPG